MEITLKTLRSNYDLSQKQAAKLVGVSEDTWRRWEKAKTFPDVLKIKRIEQIFDVNYNDIVFLPSVTV
ncbi:helix-turn-helix transcriptional regulator [Vagococcus fluvialis]|uniref:helix-turn-helix transcriptional regulator n=1 Tax=Vagococcus fluvialis TaxID=2738 RepID=UPI00378D3DF9